MGGGENYPKLIVLQVQPHPGPVDPGPEHRNLSSVFV